MRLMHCPYCGDEESVRPFCTQPEASGTKWQRWQYNIVCGVCDARGPSAESTSKAVAKETAINNWNNRIPHDEDLALRIAFTMI